MISKRYLRYKIPWRNVVTCTDIKQEYSLNKVIQCITYFTRILNQKLICQSAGAVEYTDCTSVEG